MKLVKKTIKWLLISLAILIALGVSAMIYFTLTDYKPKPVETISKCRPADIIPLMDEEFSLITWNIGYCGLDKSMDFFYDGGTKVRPTADNFGKSLNAVFNFISKQYNTDFILLQEVDSSAKRSYNTNEFALFSDALPDHTPAFATNYNAKFVPMPILRPMGGVVSGIATFSRTKPALTERYSYPFGYSWPLKLFMLDRCFMMQRFPLANGHDLIVINTHNSAFANADVMRQYELWLLRSFLLAEYGKGNYVIAGGDWNLTPPGYEKVKYLLNYRKKTGTQQIPADYLPKEWRWCYDSLTPTNRDVTEAYRPGVTPVTIIDFFVTSPNIMVKSVETIDLGFDFSDHQPVFLQILLDNSPFNTCSGEVKTRITQMQDSLKMFTKEKPKKTKKKSAKR